MKKEILEILEANKGRHISGNEIANRLGISRNAVWKTIKSLQNEGYAILAGTNRGYCLTENSDILSEQSILPYLRTNFCGRSVDVYKTIDSTNTAAKGLAQRGAPHGKVIAAETQTGGRGRMERNFFSPENAGVYFSTILRPALSMEHAPLITACAAVAAAEAIERVAGVETKIKWVNDIFVNGKKLVGILTEASMNFESGMLEYAVVGIGVNVFTKEFPEALREVATSLALESNWKISRSELIAEILNSFEKYYDSIQEKTFLPEYIRRSNLIGKEITVIGAQESYPALAVGIDDSARLIVRLSDGSERVVNSGEVSVKAAKY